MVTPTSVSITSNTIFYAVYSVQAINSNLSITLPNTNAITFDTSTSQSAMRSQMYSAFVNVTGTAMTRVRFGGSSGTSYGTLYTNSGRTALYTNLDYSYGSGSYPLSAVYYQPVGNQGTYSISYTAYDELGNTVSGTASFINSTSSSTKISYTVAPGSRVSFRPDDFYNALQTGYPNTSLQYVTLSTSDTLNTTDGTVYYNYNGNNSFAFTRGNLDDYKYYYSNSRYGDYDLSTLSFAAGTSATNRTVTLSYRAYATNGNYVDGTVEIKVTGSASNKIVYTVAAGKEVTFNSSDFNRVYQSVYSGSVRWVTFSTSSTMDTANGTVYYNRGGRNEVAFTHNTIDDYKYYYSSSSYGTYDLGSLSFVAGTGTTARTVTLNFRAYNSDNSYVDGTLEIRINGSTQTTINYKVQPGEAVTFNTADFNKVYQTAYSDTVRWVTFSAPSALDTCGGTVYYDYGGRSERSFTRSNIDDYNYYYSSSSYGDYSLGSLSFLAGSSFTSPISISFRAYYSSDYYVDGTLTLTPTASEAKGDILYYATYGTNLQLNANDFARFLNQKYPGYNLQYVKFDGVPDKGTLNYNYYGVSNYGSNRLQLTSSNCNSQLYYFSPTTTNQYSLSDLTYVPANSNYCATIPFTAYSGSGGRNVSGNVLISVSYRVVAEVYGVTPKGVTVTLPASAISTAVANATSATLSSIRFLALPTPSAGALYEGSNTRASTDKLYNTSAIGQLRFIPASNFTGSVELPYVAYNSSGTSIASGKVCLGVVTRVNKFKDMNSSTWCYKYVTELSDASVINGYEDGAFKPNGTVTYGAALKLVMLASGYSAQKPTGSHVFSGYLTRAKADGLISGTVNLNKPITRQAVAQLAAKAMKLNTTNLSTSKPFTDTSDVYVQALNAAGIVEGYFDNGTSTFKPNGTLTRGQVSAIIWRMERAGS